jgi:hypothetical protein
MRNSLMSVLLEDVEKGITLYDPLSIDFKKFTWPSGYYPHKISKTEIAKPYLISYAYYGTVDYEDIILLLNNIEDPFEMVPGKELRIPKLVDLEAFILKYKK